MSGFLMIVGHFLFFYQVVLNSVAEFTLGGFVATSVRSWWLSFSNFSPWRTISSFFIAASSGQPPGAKKDGAASDLQESTETAGGIERFSLTVTFSSSNLRQYHLQLRTHIYIYIYTSQLKYKDFCNAFQQELCCVCSSLCIIRRSCHSGVSFSIFLI